MGREDHLAVYRLTVHVKQNEKRIHQTISHRNITKSQGEGLLNGYNNDNSCRVIKHYLVID